MDFRCLIILDRTEDLEDLTIACSTKSSRCWPSCTCFTFIIFSMSFKNQQNFYKIFFFWKWQNLELILILWRIVGSVWTVSEYDGGCSACVSDDRLFAEPPDSSDFPIPMPIKIPSPKPMTNVQNFALAQSFSPEIS